MQRLSRALVHVTLLSFALWGLACSEEESKSESDCVPLELTNNEAFGHCEFENREGCLVFLSDLFAESAEGASTEIASSPAVLRGRLLTGQEDKGWIEDISLSFYLTPSLLEAGGTFEVVPSSSDITDSGLANFQVSITDQEENSINFLFEQGTLSLSPIDEGELSGTLDITGHLADDTPLSYKGNFHWFVIVSCYRNSEYDGGWPSCDANQPSCSLDETFETPFCSQFKMYSVDPDRLPDTDCDDESDSGGSTTADPDPEG